jgi:DNA-directed RNA polymerase subunit F
VNPKTQPVIIAILSLVALGAAGLAWHQHHALTSLRAVHDITGESSDELRERLTQAEQRAHDLENELAALRAPADHESNRGDAENNSPATTVDRTQAGPQRAPEQRRNTTNPLASLAENPRFITLVNTDERARLDSRFSSLFKELTTSGTLTPQQVEVFKDLLVEKQNAVRDTRIAARANGITNRDEVRKLTQSAQAEIDKQIQSQLGTAAYEYYKEFEQTQPQRAVVNQLAQRLSYSAAPLNDFQSRQLIKILADSAKTTTNAASSRGGSGVRLNDEVIARAQPVLSAPQLEALQALKRQQEAQEEILKMIRAGRQKPAERASSSPGTAPPTTAK